MKEYNSATVLESTVFLIFCFSSSIRLPYAIPSLEDRSRDSAKNTVIPLCDEPSSLFRQEASRNPSILNGPVSGLKLYWL